MVRVHHSQYFIAWSCLIGRTSPFEGGECWFESNPCNFFWNHRIMVLQQPAKLSDVLITRLAGSSPADSVFLIKALTKFIYGK